MGAAGSSADPVILNNHRDQVNTLAFSSDGRWLATGGGDPAGDNTDNAVRLWDLRGAVPAAEPVLLSGHEKWISTLAFSPECDTSSGASDEADSGTEERCVRWLATGSGDRTVRLWDLSAADVITSPLVLTGHEGPITALAFSPECSLPSGASSEAALGSTERCTRWLVTGSQDKTARLWDLSAADPIRATHVLRGHESIVRALAISPDGRWLATNSDYTTFLWDLSALGADPIRPAHTLHQHSDFVTSLAFSPDSRWLATGGGSSDKTIRVWDLRAADPAANPRILTGPQDEVTVLAFSPGCDSTADVSPGRCGHWLAAGSQDNTTWVWRVGADGPGGSPYALLGHLQPVSALAFRADGKWLATGSDDKSTRLWDLRFGDPDVPPVVLAGHSDRITAVAFSPDGRRLAAGGKDHTVRLWSLSLGHLIGLACSGAGRNLTQEEWREFFPDAPYHKTCLQWP